MSLLYALLEILPTGYILSSTLLLGGLAIPAYRTGARRQLNTSNLVLLVVAIGVLLTTSTMVYASLTVGSETDNFPFLNRIAGPYWFLYWGGFLCQGVLPQLFWFARLRRSPFATSLVVSVLIFNFCSFIFLTHGRDYLPSSWSMRPNYSVLLTSALVYISLLAAIAGLGYWRTRLLAASR